jgi:hypothetical protein
MKMFHVAAAAAALGCCCIGAAWAADDTVTLGESFGKVMVSSDDGLLPGYVGTPLTDGTQVLVSEQSQASIVYRDCEVLLDRPVIYTVDTAGGCENGLLGISAMIEPTAGLF